ncbi:class I SAM-dependent methyltransferase [Nocardioides ungokensis]|uniref:class I SAM-dependent methyltransferase n=1 Tax=Nocardioides ungokensis TaxID=1643322 RepID=UPI0015DFB501|nr:class I SAM-dependent methyltransferase [Nocardioides ungokensis]
MTDERTTPGEGAFSQATGRSLEDSSGADQRRYRAFQLEMIRPHCGPSVLEVGAGLGEFAAQFHGLRRHVVTDVDPGCVASMAARFADRPEVSSRQLDLTGGAIDIGEPVSTIVAINVLEHIEDDAGALRALASMVEPGGRIVLWVPGYQQLYGEFDRAVGHVRRYTPATLTSAFVRAGLAPDVVRPVNLLGGIAWWLTVRRGGVGQPRPGLVRTYDRFVVPVTRFVERRVTPPFGQSVLGVGVVPG